MMLTCSGCDGLGKVPAEDWSPVICEDCGGSGQVMSLAEQLIKKDQVIKDLKHQCVQAGKKIKRQGELLNSRMELINKQKQQIKDLKVKSYRAAAGIKNGEDGVLR